MKHTVSGRVIRHTPYQGVVVRVDTARGWDPEDADATIELPGAAELPPAGAHVTITVEWQDRP